MDNDGRFPLSTSREPNPLRPYYVSPSIGHPSTSASPSQPAHPSRPTPSAASLSSSARDYFPEIDLDIKSTTSEAWQHTRTLLDTLVWRYTSVLLAQPFDVAKTVLQVSLPQTDEAAAGKKKKTSPKRTASSRYSDRGRSGRRQYEDDYSDGEEDESDGGIPDYFTSTAPTRSRSPRRRNRTPQQTSLSPSPTPTPPKDRREQDETKLRLKNADSVMQALSSIYNASGAVGLWRGTNCSFLYTILQRSTDSFVRSLLLALLGLPDIAGPDPSGLGPGLAAAGSMGFSGLDLSSSPNALGSLVVVGMASCIAGLILAPLDLVRTRLILTPTWHAPRGLIQNLRQLPSVVAPSALWLPTTLYHGLPTLFSAASPVVLRRNLRISPELTPALWSLASFTTSLTDLFLRLPLETVLRRAQLTTLIASEKTFSESSSSTTEDLPLIVSAAPYKGVWGTVYSILYLEGETTTKDSKGMVRKRRGQGVAGLVRGWRVGFWGLVGVWGGGALGPGEKGGRGEF